MDLKIGERFTATDRLGRTSTWKLIRQKDDIHFLLEACDDTLKKCEEDYFHSLKGKGRMMVNTKTKRVSKNDFCTIEVGPAWFQYRSIEIIEDSASAE